MPPRTKDNENVGMSVVEVPKCYAVFYRHFQMNGGIFTYGTAEIVEFCDTYAKADKIAKGVFEQNEGAPDLHVWVMQCLKTYQNGGIAIERGFVEPEEP